MPRLRITRSALPLLAGAMLAGALPATAQQRTPLLFVSNEGSRDVSVVDTRTRRVVGSIRVRKRPWKVAVGQ